MTIKKAYFSLLLLGLMACHPAGKADEIAPTVSLPLASESAEPVSPSAIAKPATVLPNESASVGPKQAGWDPADNTMEKCFSILAYDPNDTSVNLRDQPDGDIIVSLPNFTLLSTEPGMAPAFIDSGWNHVHLWQQDQSDFISGYIWQDLIRHTYYQVQDPQDTDANFRQSPNGPVLDTLPNGTEVRFMGESGTWTQVELASGQTGYVATALLTTPACF